VGETPVAVDFRLLPNVPNPFNPSTRISFELADHGQGDTPVSLRVFDLQGRLVRVLLEQRMPAASHTAVWDGRNQRGGIVPSGVYVYRLNAGGQTLARTMTLAK
jgi:flagellar hook assembly protein FlgD